MSRINLESPDRRAVLLTALLTPADNLKAMGDEVLRDDQKLAKLVKIIGNPSREDGFLDSVHVPFTGRKWTETGLSTESRLTNKILGYSAQ